MKPLTSLLLFLLLLAPITAVAAENAALGYWECVATSADANDQPINFSLNVKETGGKLAVVFVATESGETLAVSEPKVDGKNFTFKVDVHDEPYTVELKVDGGKLTGKYSGENGNGTIAGARKS